MVQAKRLNNGVPYGCKYIAIIAPQMNSPELWLVISEALYAKGGMNDTV